MMLKTRLTTIILFSIVLACSFTAFADKNEEQPLCKHLIKDSLHPPKPSAPDMLKCIEEMKSSNFLTDEKFGKTRNVFIAKAIEASHKEVFPKDNSSKEKPYINSEITFLISETYKNTETDLATSRLSADVVFCGDDFEIGRDYLIFVDTYFANRKAIDEPLQKRYQIHCSSYWGLERKDNLRYPLYGYNPERIRR